MIINLINQEPITISDEAGQKAIAAIKAGAEYITVDGEYIRTSSITSIRHDDPQDKYVLWGSTGTTKRLAEYAERKFSPEGLATFQAARRKLGL